MTHLFTRIGSLLERKPFRSLLISLGIIILMVFGVSQMRMATGNETLVQKDNPVLVHTIAMEDSFGGDSILVLLDASSAYKIQNVKNTALLYHIEEVLKTDKAIFSVMSPASLVHQITVKQADYLKENLLEIAGGLNTLGTKIAEIGDTLAKKNIKDPKEILDKLNQIGEISAKFETLASGQTKLGTGINQMELGLYQVSTGLTTVSNQMAQLALSQSDMTLKTSLNQISTQLGQSATSLHTMGVNTQSLQQATSSTSGALISIKDNLTNEINQMKEGLDQGFSKTEIKKMAEGFKTMGAQLQQISTGLETYYVKSSMMVPYLPVLQTELDTMLFEDNQLRSIFSDVVLNDKQSMMVIKLQGNLSDTDKIAASNRVIELFNETEFDQVEWTLSGKSVLDSALQSEMKSSMVKMVMIAVAIMAIVLLLVFKVRWRMLSLGVIFISVVGTIGLMSWLKVPVTMVSMAVFPILIGLGIDYSIQFHNRYEESQSVSLTIRQMGKAVAIAVLATVLGFISLYVSPVPMIQDFGKMLTIGVIVSFLGSLFLLMPVLQIAKQNTTARAVKTSEEMNNSKAKRFSDAFTKITLKFGIIILLAVFSLAGYGFYVDSKVSVETDIETFMPQDLPALLDIQTIRSAIDSTDQMVLYIQSEKMIDKNDLLWISGLEAQLERLYPSQINSIKSLNTLVNNTEYDLSLDDVTLVDVIESLPLEQRKLLVNETMDKTLVLINTKHLSTSDTKVLITNIQKELSSTDLKIELVGKSVMDVEMVEGLTSGRISMTLWGLGLVVAALLILYRNLVKALLPIIPVVLIIGISSFVMYQFNIAFTPITATLGALVLGMGTEMTVMLMERYLEERMSGLQKEEAMLVAVRQIGKAILASGLTTVGGFAVLLFSSFAILKDFGFMTVINISLALISTFVVLPPLILILDKFIVNRKLIKG